jgi:hypothetical protein
MVEHALLDRLRTKAKSLQNGKRADVATLCDVVCDMAHLLASIAEHGCHKFDEEHAPPGFSWPACVAYLATLGTIAGLILSILHRTS